MLNFSSSLFPAAVRTLLALLLLVGGLPAAAQAPVWQSAQAVAAATAAATSGYSTVNATATDAAGNVYLAGYFTNTAVLGSTTLTSSGNNDVFVAKFNPVSNQFVWAQQAGGTGGDYATALAVSGTSVYVTGAFLSRTADFGTTTLTSASPGSATDLFVAKLTDAGNTGSFVWAQRAGGTLSDNATALAVSGTSVYVAGEFTSPTAGFGAIILAKASPTTTASDVFVAKLTDAGSMSSFVWAQRAGGPDDDEAHALAVNGNGVYVAGRFNSPTIDFGATTLTTAGDFDVFMAKLTDAGSTGSFAWAQRAGGTGSDVTNGLSVNGSSVYIAGSFSSSTANFGPSTLTNASSTGTADVFVTKLTDAGSTGSFAWAQQAGGTDYDEAYTVAVSGTSVYVAGVFNGTAAAFGATTLTNSSGAGVFVAKLTDAGNSGSFAWAQQASGTGRLYATELTVSSTSVYMAGYFDSSATFGPITLPTASPSSRLGFLASLTDPTLTATTPPRAAPAALYPNPAHGTATLRLSAGATPAPLTLCDAQGRAVRRYPAPASPEVVLDLGGLPAGLYLLRGGNFSQRLAVE